MNRMKKIQGDIYIAIGVVLIALAAFLVRYNLNENAEAGAASEEFLEGVIQQMPDTVLPEAVSGPMPVVDVVGRSFVGTVEIPSLGLLLPIQDEWSKTNARLSICRYMGSAYDNDLIVCGHNYPEHFGNLNQLKSGDSVIVTDMNGRSFYYQVTNMETLGAYDSFEMEEGDWDFTMFTCTVGGANRVTIRCEATGEVSETGSEPDVLKAVRDSRHKKK